MKKFLVSTVLALFLALSLISATPVLAANELTFDADTTINLPDLSIDLIIKSGSVVDSMTANSGSISFTVSTGNNLTIESSNQRTMTLSPALAGQAFTCATPSILAFSPQTGVSGQVVILTPSTATCNSGGGTTSSSGTSGSTSQTTTTTTTATPTTTTTAESPTTSATTPTSAAAKAADMIKNILSEAATLFSDKPTQLAAKMGIKVDAKTEDAAEAKYTAKLVSGLKTVAEKAKDAITYFVAYGTPTTKILGAGERAGVVNSYKSAFGKLPATETEWSDALKIGNGRWPTERSAESENNATTAFKKIYKRSSDRKNPHDDAAVTVMAYGLRPSNRNLNSEKAAIKSFRAIYGYDPKSATAWDIVRAIAYSGATR